MAGPMRELCSGRIPQNAILSRARIDPVAVLGPSGAGYADTYYACPPNVPLFTTDEGLKSLSPGGGMNGNGKRGRTAGDEAMIPVIAYIPANSPGDRKLIFVGVSYSGGSQSRPVVSVATGGQMPLPHEESSETASRLIGAACWWKRATGQYGSAPDFHIAVPAPYTAEDRIPDIRFVDPKERALCGISVQQATGMDCAVLLGVPPF